VINSNLGLILHRYWDTTSYWPKIANFDHPLSFRDLVRGDPLRIYEKALRFLKLESFMQPMVKIWWSYVAPFLPDPPVWQTDGQTELRWLRRAESIAAFARKNQAIIGEDMGESVVPRFLWATLYSVWCCMHVYRCWACTGLSSPWLCRPNNGNDTVTRIDLLV